MPILLSVAALVTQTYTFYVTAHGHECEIIENCPYNSHVPTINLGIVAANIASPYILRSCPHSSLGVATYSDTGPLILCHCSL